jgi:hypothetical protein
MIAQPAVWTQQTRSPVNLKRPSAVTGLENEMLNINIVFVATVVLILAVLAMIWAYVMNRSQQRVAVRKALIDKFASAQDLNSIMETPAGRRLFAEFSTGGSPLRPVLSSIRMGILAVLAGVGVGGLGLLSGMAPILGVAGLLVCIGVGFLISAVITYRLSKSWGLLEKKD